jgi:septum formation protein
MAAQVILASASSIRSQMLHNVGINHEICPARIDEDAIKASLISELTEPRDLAIRSIQNPRHKMISKVFC